MTKRLKIILLLSIVIAFKAVAQVKPITYAGLQSRISNTDTLYIINFWATWCGPCVAELPNFAKLQSTYKNKPLKVLLVSMDFQSKYKTSLVPFVNKHKLSAEFAFASRRSDQEFIDQIDKNWSGALPATLVVNTKKKFRQFYEKTFTFNELNQIYQSHKN
jgi:thiol-disulfide isomerase/thioredoxin